MLTSTHSPIVGVSYFEFINGVNLAKISSIKKVAVYVLVVKFIFSEKATKFCKTSTLLLFYVVPVKSKISQNFVAFSEYMNFKIGCCWMKEEDIPRLHLHISERAVANHNSYDLISGKNVLGLNTYLNTTFAGQSRYRVEKARIGHFVKVQIF